MKIMDIASRTNPWSMKNVENIFAYTHVRYVAGMLLISDQAGRALTMGERSNFDKHESRFYEPTNKFFRH